MTYNLNEITFDNDFYFIEKTNGDIIVLNKLDEEIQTQYEQDLEIITEELDLGVINVGIIRKEGNQETTSNIIGLATSDYTIKSDYSEYVGHQLTKDNLAYCTLEVIDED